MSTQDTTLPPLDSTIAGALFDLMGWLTSHETRWVFSSRDHAGAAVEALEQWAKAKGFALADANVTGWRARATLVDAKKELQQIIADIASRAAFLDSHPAVTKELCDLIEENERLKAAIAAQAQQSAVVKESLTTEQAQQAQGVPAAQVPKAACMDQFCACRGGPAASCEEGEREAELESQRSSLEFYKKRCDLLQQWQSKMRDPERTIVCDILANGQTLPESTGRYATPGLHLEVTQIDVALYDCAQLQSELDAKPQMPFAQYGQCETCGVFSDSARALHDAKRNCGDSKGEAARRLPEPQAEPQPEREPLTDEQMWELWNSQGIDEMNQKEAVTFARAIERAHGIGTKGGE